MDSSKNNNVLSKTPSPHLCPSTGDRPDQPGDVRRAPVGVVHGQAEALTVHPGGGPVEPQDGGHAQIRRGLHWRWVEVWKKTESF